MSSQKATDSPLKSPTESGRESPTTVRPLDMDDDEAPETSATSTSTANPSSTTENPPAKPPRPLSPQQQAENTLKEAFPSIDAAVVKAVLIASGGRVEPAFNALLGMSDPSAVVEETPPPQPPRPTANLSQLESDEQYARQLAQHYDGRNQYARSGSRRQQPAEPERDFFNDDLPEIKESLKTGFLETQKTVNGWLTTLKKKIDGEEDTPGQSRPGQYAQSGPGAQYGRRSGDNRRSGDYNRYDADPQVLGDDFAGIQLNEDGSKSRQSLEALRAELDAKRAAGQAQQRRSTRPLANPDLFKPTPAIPRQSNDGRKVAFQDNSDIYDSSPKSATATPTKTSKWQPLSAVDPSPVGDNENDNDPFSLGDSEDENPNKDRVGGTEVKSADAERLKRAASETGVGKPESKLEEAEKVGSKDKEAHDALTK